MAGAGFESASDIARENGGSDVAIDYLAFK